MAPVLILGIMKAVVGYMTVDDTAVVDTAFCGCGGHEYGVMLYDVVNKERGSGYGGSQDGCFRY